MNKDVFRQVKNAVSMRDVLAMCGIGLNHKLISCPAHTDRKPSMQVNKDSYYCHSCGASGDCVSFVALFYDISQIEALRRIDSHFGLGIVGEKPKCLPKRKHRGNSQPDYAGWRSDALDFIAWLCRLYRFDLTTQAAGWLEGLHQAILESEPIAAWYDFRDAVYALGEGVEIYGKRYIESRCL